MSEPVRTAVEEVTRALDLRPGRLLLDLACGRGGFGLEIAGRTGAGLVGVDFSAEALRGARQLAAELGRDARFELGRLEDCGLGGRVALTCWEAVDRTDDRVPERLRLVDLDHGLHEAGFEGVEVLELPHWRELELACWREAAALDPGDDPALRSFHDEGVHALSAPYAVRRVLATAT